MEELKRCPFCGGEAETRCSVAYAGYVYDGYVECLECGPRTPIYQTVPERLRSFRPYGTDIRRYLKDFLRQGPT